MRKSQGKAGFHFQNSRCWREETFGSNCKVHGTTACFVLVSCSFLVLLTRSSTVDSQAFCSSCDQGRPDQHQLSPASHSGCWTCQTSFSLAPWGICMLNSAGMKIPPWSTGLSLQMKFAAAEPLYLLHLVRLRDLKM